MAGTSDAATTYSRAVQRIDREDDARDRDDGADVDRRRVKRAGTVVALLDVVGHGAQCGLLMYQDRHPGKPRQAMTAAWSGGPPRTLGIRGSTLHDGM